MNWAFTTAVPLANNSCKSCARCGTHCITSVSNENDLLAAKKLFIEMSLQESFDAIVCNPRIYSASNAGKPNYAAGTKAVCDRCGLRGLETYVSSPSTPQIDLCPTCFNTLKASSPSVGAPHNVVHHSFSPSSGGSGSPGGPQFSARGGVALGGGGEK